MKKRNWGAGVCLGILLAAGGVSADSWNGSVTALETVRVTAPAEGIAEALTLETGARTEEGVTAGMIRAEKIFAPEDGTVSVIMAEEGETVTGAVLEISPVSLYTVTCTVTDVAQTPETALIHIGEMVYIRCMADGSHRAEAVVTAVSGAEWTAETTAGELYVGEAVYLYRDPEYAAASRIGKGTVTAHDPLTVTAGGVITRMRVAAGDRVERGQWLFSVASAEETEIRVPAAGIVTGVSVSPGDRVTEGQELAEIAVSCAIRVTVPADEAGQFAPGQTWMYTRGDDPHENLYPCRVSRVLIHEEDASGTVELIPEGGELLPVGMTVTITADAR